MSLEKRRETKEPDEEKMLEESIFRQKDFTPLQEKLKKGESAKDIAYTTNITRVCK